MQGSRIESFLQIKKAIECITSGDTPDNIMVSPNIIHSRVPEEIFGYSVESDEEKSEGEEESENEDGPQKKKVKNLESDWMLLKNIRDFYGGPSFCAAGWVKPYASESRLWLSINARAGKPLAPINPDADKAEPHENWVSCGQIYDLQMPVPTDVIDFKLDSQHGNTVNVKVDAMLLTQKSKLFDEKPRKGNIKWAQLDFVQNIREDVAARLGISHDIELTATRMYFFMSTSARNDSRPADHSTDSLGTVLIALPSPLEGGKVIVTNGGTSQTLKLDSASGGFSWVAYGRDSSARVTEIINGQLILVSFDINKKVGERKYSTYAVMKKKAIACTKTNEVSKRLLSPVMKNIASKLDEGKSVGILLPKK